jgi:general secretion pathway protein B
MSSILDALRKSEHERHMASGQSASMLYPVEIKPEGKPWLYITALALTLLAALATVLWLEFRPTSAEPANSLTAPSNSTNSQSQAISNQMPTEHSTIIPKENIRKDKVSNESSQKKIHASAHLGEAQQTTIHKETIPNTPNPINKTATTEDPLKGLPALNIAGYIHNAQTGNLAMINNRLVHEGEEVSPGLILVKILDDKAVFSFNGFEFSR